MHSGAANTVLRNNRKLLNKRSDKFRSKRKVMGYTDADIAKFDDKNRRLTTLSASEMKRIGRKYRRRNRVETIIMLILVLSAIIWVFSSFSTAETTSKVIMLETHLEMISVDQPKTQEAAYMDFGRAFYYQGNFKRAKKMFENVLKLQPDHCQAQVWLVDTQEIMGDKHPLKSLKKVMYKAKRYTIANQ